MQYHRFVSPIKNYKYFYFIFKNRIINNNSFFLQLIWLIKEFKYFKILMILVLLNPNNKFQVFCYTIIKT